MTSDTANATNVLAHWAVATSYDDVPESAAHAVKRSIVDSIGVMAAGSRHAAVDVLLATIEDSYPAVPLGSHRVTGRPVRLDILNATLVNGVMAHVLDFDDTILPTRCHISAPLLSALLATSERAGASGKDVITAFAIGFELVTRCADAVYSGRKGWHGTGIMGPLGVAAAVGRLLGLDEPGTGHAFALGANQASGLRASFGSMAKAWNLGRAGANGVHAALLAHRGFTGGWNILDPGAGFLDLFSDAPEYGVLTQDLGGTWAVERNGFKPHPCGFVAHASIDAVLRARSQRFVEPDEIESIRLTVSPETLQLTSKQHPTTGLEAKFSVYHAAAASYLDGYVSPETFTDQTVHDDRYRSLAARVEAHADPDYRQGEASVEIVSEKGTKRAYVADALGSAANPMTDSQLQEKFDRLAQPVFGARATELAGLLWRLDEHSMSEVIECMDHP